MPDTPAPHQWLDLIVQDFRSGFPGNDYPIRHDWFGDPCGFISCATSDQPPADNDTRNPLLIAPKIAAVVYAAVSEVSASMKFAAPAIGDVAGEFLAPPAGARILWDWVYTQMQKIVKGERQESNASYLGDLRTRLDGIGVWMAISLANNPSIGVHRKGELSIYLHRAQTIAGQLMTASLDVQKLGYDVFLTAANFHLALQQHLVAAAFNEHKHDSAGANPAHQRAPTTDVTGLVKETVGYLERYTAHETWVRRQLIEQRFDAIAVDVETLPFGDTKGWKDAHIPHEIVYSQSSPTDHREIADHQRQTYRVYVNNFMEATLECGKRTARHWHRTAEALAARA